MTEPGFVLPEDLRHALAGDTKGLSFSAATWGMAFPELEDLGRLPAGAELVAIASEPKHIDLLHRAEQLVAVKAYPTTAQ